MIFCRGAGAFFASSARFTAPPRAVTGGFFAMEDSISSFFPSVLAGVLGLASSSSSSTTFFLSWASRLAVKATEPPNRDKQPNSTSQLKREVVMQDVSRSGANVECVLDLVSRLSALRPSDFVANQGEKG